MKDRSFIYKYNNEDIRVDVVTKPFQRGTYFYYRNGSFYVTTNRLASDAFIKKGLDRFASRLINHSNKRNIKAYDLSANWFYLFGEKRSGEFLSENEFKSYLKKELISYLDIRVPYYEKLMNISTSYKYRIKQMKSRYGSNSYQTHTLSFQLDLVHFSYPIIDSVIVHELAHEFERNHQQSFYKIVLKYCPNYYELKAKLRRRCFK